MADCEFLKNCLFFNDRLENMPTFANTLKEKFCKNDYSNCARYIVAKARGKDKVPDDLYPNHVDRVDDFIKS